MMSTRYPVVSLALAAAVSLTACDSSTEPGSEDPPTRISELPRALSEAEHEVIGHSNEFAFDLLRETYAEEAETPNVFLSPLSASMALGMALNGAADETFDAMRGALRFDGLSQEEINRAYRDLVELLLDLDAGVDMRIANSAWAKQGLPFRSEFFDAIQTWFDAQAEERDFSDPATLDAINTWADEHTNSRIQKVLDKIDRDHILFLLNAVYFNGNWTHRFDAGETRPSPFTLADGTEVEVERMNGELRAGVRYVDGVQIGELAYGGQAFVMNLALPPEDGSLEELVASLDAETWEGWIEGFPEDYEEAQEIQVGLPKLELSYGKELNDALAKLGMGVAFQPGSADFTRLIDLPRGEVYIDFVKQDTYLRVDEEGTEAAAVTNVGFKAVSAPPSLVVDRPYLLVIRERLTGTILFMGAIGDPRHSGE